MDTGLRPRLAVTERTADTMAAARRDVDETTKEADAMSAAGYHERRTETKTGGGVEFPFVM